MIGIMFHTLCEEGGDRGVSYGSEADRAVEK